MEDLNVFYSQEECISLEPAQQPTSEKEEGSVGEMKLLGKKSSPLLRLNAAGKACFSPSSQTFYSHHQITHTFQFCFLHGAEPASYGGNFPCILGIARVEGTSLGKQSLLLMY